MGRIGPTEIIIVAVLIIVIFGWKKLPDAARSLGPVSYTHLTLPTILLV